MSEHRHVDEDDPSYAGFRIRELWMLVATGADDMDGIVSVPPSAAMEFHLMPGPAFAADDVRKDNLVSYARWLRERLPDANLRLMHFATGAEVDIG